MELFIGLGGIELLFVLAILGFFILLPLIALIDALRSSFHGNDKLVWVLVILLFPFLGAILYFVIGRNQRIP